uniref:CCT domain-containing protein n=1 Tax=Odontella aurita TaxID=265563 RepID=A0A7S4N7Z6_9STRA|mmetsp:Transcript_51204/g.153816  ORF Transcript_51204/g.153816 Transcript_51204/m.153816 type:complete len:751 (+) Transcript_51204:1001-3253(+)
MIASATTTVTPVHAGNTVLSGRTKAEVFRSGQTGKVSSGSSSGNSTEEEDALLEQEEERLLLQDEAEQHMLNVVLAHSVEDSKGKGAGAVRDRAKDQLTSAATQGQVPVLGDSGDKYSLNIAHALPEKDKSKLPQPSSSSEGGSVVDSYLGTPTNTPCEVPTTVPPCTSPGQRRTRKSVDCAATTSKGKDGEGVWLGTRKRRRDYAMKPTPDTSNVDCLKGNSTLNGGKASDVILNCGNPVQSPPHRRKGQALVPKPRTGAQSSCQLESVASKSAMPSKKRKATKSSSCEPSTSLLPDAIPSRTSSSYQNTNTKNSTSQVPAYTTMSAPTVVSADSGTSSTGPDKDAVMQPPAAPARNRIFSVDLDPAGFDFESSVGVTWSSPACVPTAGNSENVPPISSLPQSHGVANIFCDSQQGAIPGAAVTGRDRGMSFELFSLGVNVEEPLPPIPSFRLDASLDASAGRPRGDSIIFDPISFSDGGIHEESALQRTRNTLLSMEETDELEIMNSPGFVEAPVSCLKPLSVARQQFPPPPPLTSKAPHGSKVVPVPSPLLVTSTSVPSPLLRIPSNPSSQPPHNPLPVSSSAFAASKNGTHNVVPKPLISQREKNRQTGKKMAAPLLPVSSSITSGGAPVTGVRAQSSEEKVINMPHGSAAAAAAAMAVPSNVVPSSLNGTATSHTACPMELLNKGGRIGIYLPEARKARIAKFHSKRKMRIWRKRIKYDCRKKLADSRPRIKGRFVKRSDMDEEE